MDAPSQNMNALSVQSLFFVNDDDMHEIDLRVLAKLPETLRVLQAQVQSLSAGTAAASPEPQSPEAPVAEVQDASPSFSRRARAAQQQQPGVVA